MDSHENKPQQSKNEQETARVVAEAIAKLQQFRQNLYNFFPHRADASMELIDAFLPRKLAEPLPDRTFVHCPNTIAGNKPVTIGHDYSVLSFLPEKASPRVPPWVVPLVVRRVKSTEKASQVGAEQITAVVTDEMLPLEGKLCVHVEDSAYSGREHLGAVAPIKNLVSVIRFPGNRVVYRKFELPEGEENPAAAIPVLALSSRGIGS